MCEYICVCLLVCPCVSVGTCIQLFVKEGIDGQITTTNGVTVLLLPSV